MNLTSKFLFLASLEGKKKIQTLSNTKPASSGLRRMLICKMKASQIYHDIHYTRWHHKFYLRGLSVWVNMKSLVHQQVCFEWTVFLATFDLHVETFGGAASGIDKVKQLHGELVKDRKQKPCLSCHRDYSTNHISYLVLNINYLMPSFPLSCICILPPQCNCNLSKGKMFVFYTFMIAEGVLYTAVRQ